MFLLHLLVMASPDKPILAERLSCRSCSPLIQNKSAIAQKLPTSCPTIIEELPREPRIGPTSTNIGRSGFGRFGPNLARPSVVDLVDVGQLVAGVGQILPRHGQAWPNVVKFGSSQHIRYQLSMGTAAAHRRNPSARRYIAQLAFRDEGRATP